MEGWVLKPMGEWEKLGEFSNEEITEHIFGRMGITVAVIEVGTRNSFTKCTNQYTVIP